MGLGHVRRNLLIAQVLSKSPLEPNIMLISGAKETENFSLPLGVDCTILPSLYKAEDGQYRARRFHMSLTEIISLRKKILHASIVAFDPDLVIVDGVPRGAVGELDSTLDLLRSQGTVRCVLGMRDIWDEPAVVDKEWQQKNNWDAIRRYYDQIWIYGDPTIYSATQEYHINQDIASKIQYTGYLNQTSRLELIPRGDPHYSRYGIELPDGPFVLCLMGGGQDGAFLAKNFIDAELPPGISAVIVTGPYMEPKDREHLLLHAAKKSHIRVFDFVPEPTLLLQKAECVVSMGGYNTICEIMSFKKHALIVPRVIPRKEQLIRAQRLERLGFLDVLHPDNLNPEAITRFVQQSIRKKPPEIQIDMDGLARVRELVESLLAQSGSCTTDCRVGGTS
jgi:predicted glycosyltransferase